MADTIAIAIAIDTYNQKLIFFLQKSDFDSYWPSGIIWHHKKLGHIQALNTLEL